MPCSPLSVPPSAAHSAISSAAAAIAWSITPGVRASKSIHGCKLPSPAWNTLAMTIPYRSLTSDTLRSICVSRVRGTTPSTR